jgi:hypothetical protein
MTQDRRALIELLQKSGDADFPRSVAAAVWQIPMEADTDTSRLRPAPVIPMEDGKALPD